MCRRARYLTALSLKELIWAHALSRVCAGTVLMATPAPDRCPTAVLRCLAVPGRFACAEYLYAQLQNCRRCCLSPSCVALVSLGCACDALQASLSWTRPAMLAAAFSILLLAAAAAPGAGEWVVADDVERQCGDLTLCTASNLTWAVERVYDRAAGCALLARKGLVDLHFWGDSFQRHIFVGLALTLTGAARRCQPQTRHF